VPEAPWVTSAVRDTWGMQGTERTVRVTYEHDTNMGYIYLADISPGDVERTEPLIIETAGGRRLINLDFDARGTLVGIEFDGAREALPSRLLAEIG
jgi:uncharacterized protein YuzE